MAGAGIIPLVLLSAQKMVPKGGLEPPWVAPHAPQTCVSTNSTTSALAEKICRDRYEDRGHSGRGYYFFTGASHAVCFLSLPWTISKNAACSFCVMGPGLPDPIFRLSTSRIGVISAAVPVKNASSAI